MSHFESQEPDVEREGAEYIEKLKEAIDDAREFADPGNYDDQEYKDFLEKELEVLGGSESEEF